MFINRNKKNGSKTTANEIFLCNAGNGGLGKNFFTVWFAISAKMQSTILFLENDILSKSAHERKPMKVIVSENFGLAE